MAERLTVTPDQGKDTSTPPANAKVETKDGVTTVKLDGTQTPPPADKQGERPSWLPEKFKTVEEFAKAYSELEKKQGQGKKEETPAPQAPQAPTQDAVRQAVQKAGLDMASLNTEFAENNGLTDETIAKLEAGGIPRTAIDAHIEGLRAIGQRVTGEIAKLAGGEQQLTAVIEWAGQNLTEAEKNAYNAAIDSGDEAKAKLAFQGLLANYQGKNGIEPNLVEGGEEVRGAPSVKPFQSNAEIIAAMRDKRYSTDPAYRRSVEQRIAATPMTGHRVLS